MNCFYKRNILITLLIIFVSLFFLIMGMNIASTNINEKYQAGKIINETVNKDNYENKASEEILKIPTFLMLRYIGDNGYILSIMGTELTVDFRGITDFINLKK